MQADRAEAFRGEVMAVHGESDIQALKTEVEFLLDVAERDTGQSGRVRNFLLAWWNAEECGGFDLTNLVNLDMEIATAMQRIFCVLSHYHFYPDRLGYGERFERLAKARIAAALLLKNVSREVIPR